MAPEPHELGCKYLYEMSTHSYSRIANATNPPLCIMSEVLLLAVADSVYPVHRHVIEPASQLIAKKLANNDFKRVFYAGSLYVMLHIQTPKPAQFEHVILDLYGCHCKSCDRRPRAVEQATQIIKDYLLMG